MPKEKPDKDESAVEGDLDEADEAVSSDFIQNLMFIYRAYANFVIEDYDASFNDYVKANQITKLSVMSQYNM